MSEKPNEIKGWQPYNLDHYAQELVIQNRDKKDVLNESHKMRMTVAYGLERFWGEHLRLMRERRNQDKGKYWKSVWDKLAQILQEADITLPNDNINSNDREQERKNIEAMAKEIWSLPLAEQRVILMVLTQFCDSLVWWTQRYKVKKD